MSQKIKILHYISEFSKPSETFVYDLINNLQSIGFDNQIVCHTRLMENERPFEAIDILPENKDIFDTLYYRTIKKFHIKNSFQILDAINKYKPTVIHAHFGPNGLRIYNLIKKYQLNIPLIVSCHGSDITMIPKRSRIYKYQLQKMGKDKNVYFTSPSIFLKNKMILLGLPQERINIIGNPYNNVFENPNRIYSWNKGDELKLVTVGRFHEIKGQEYLLKAFHKLQEIYEKSSLSIVGFGETETKLRKIVASYGLNEKVKFVIKANHSEIVSILNQNHIYFQPSLIAKDGTEENLSVSTIEAQISGLPSIVSKIGGLVEVVSDKETGYCVEQKNSDAIFEAIKIYIDNPALLIQHSLSANKRAESLFSSKIIMEKWKILFQNVLNGRIE